MRLFLAGVGPDELARMPIAHLHQVVTEIHRGFPGMPGSCMGCRDYYGIPRPYPCPSATAGLSELRKRADVMVLSACLALKEGARIRELADSRPRREMS